MNCLYLDVDSKMTFLNKQHNEKFKLLLKKSRTSCRDNERKALFYILSGNNELYSKLDKIYNFEKNHIKIRTKIILSSSGERLLKLAFQLYNGLSNKFTVTDTFRNLDESNKILALNAIKYRFDIA